ncbi:YEATS domain-containing protein 2-like [Glandiceps talaboti]
MATKHGAEDQDPDYQDSSTPRKRQRFLEEGAKEVTVKKIESIIRHQFSIEMKNKEKEIEVIDQRIHQVRSMLDRLRACVVATYYGMPGQPSDGETQPTISEKSGLHPAVKKVLGQSSSHSVPMETEIMTTSEEQQEEKAEIQMETSVAIETKPSGAKGPRNQGHDTFGISTPPIVNLPELSGDGTSRFHVKKRIVVGNISKYIAPDKREENDPSTHKWMVYVRGPLEEPRIDHFVKKVWFFLHPSYRPNDLVEVSEPPFHLTRRGWGEFPVRVQLHFVDQRNKKVDIIHNLKLDRTYTGLQTLGAETVVDVELDRYSVEERGTTLTKPMTSQIDKMEMSEEDIGTCHSQSQDSQTSSEFTVQDSTIENTAKPPTAVQLAERITAAQQLCIPKVKTQVSTKLQPSTDTQSQQTQNGSKVVVKGTTAAVSTATGTLSMPPLAPIGSAKTNVTNTSSVATTSSSTTSKVIQVQKSTQQRQATSSGSFVMLSSQTPSQSPGNVSVSTATGGVMTTKVRINQGKVEMSDQQVSSSLNPGIKTEIIIPQVPSQNTSIAKITPAVQTPRPTVTMATRLPAPSLSTIKTQSSVVTTAPRPQGQTPVAMPTAIAMPAGVTMTAPGVAMGTQYFIAAKSTDPNLQGKMILIPHQALVQATGQRLVAPVAQPITTQSVRPRGTTTTMQRVTTPSQLTAGKVTTGIQRVTTQQAKVQTPQVRVQTPQAKGQTVQVRGAFPIPPGNVILIPQGANIPGIQPGSIVQIQQTVPVSKQQTSTTAHTTTHRAANTSSSAVTKTTVQLTPASAVPAGMTAVPVLGTPPTVTKTTVQLTPAATVPASMTAVPVIGTQPATSLMKTAIQIPAGSQLQTIRPSTTMTSQQSVRSMPSTTATITSQQSILSMPSTATTITSQQSILSMPSTSTRTILTQPGSKPVQPTKLLVTQPATHAPIKTGVTKSVMPEIQVNPSKDDKPGIQETIKITKSVSLLKPLSSLTTVVKPGTSKLTLVSPHPQIVAKVTKPVTTIIGPRLPINVTERRIQEGCLATSKTINLNNIDSIEDIVHALVKRNPLVKKDRVIHEAPFCATTVEQYQAWAIGKQRAAEWQRATRVRKTLHEIVKMSNKWNLSDLWSTKQIVVWCRKHGFTIPDYVFSICEVCGDVKSEDVEMIESERTQTKEIKKEVEDTEEQDDKEEDEEEGEEEDDDDNDEDDEESEGEGEEEMEEEEEEDIENHECKMTWLNEDGLIAKSSLSTPKSVVDEVDRVKSELQTGDTDDELELDVVNITGDKVFVKKEVTERSDTIQMYLPSTVHSEFIQNTCQEIGVKLPPLEITKDTHAPIMEEMLLTAMLEFMNDLMRDSLAIAHGNRTDNRCPGEILPIHVYQSILNQQKYSFLTNKYLGVDAMETQDNCSSSK